MYQIQLVIKEALEVMDQSLSNYQYLERLKDFLVMSFKKLIKKKIVVLIFIFIHMHMHIQKVLMFCLFLASCDSLLFSHIFWYICIVWGHTSCLHFCAFLNS